MRKLSNKKIMYMTALLITAALSACGSDSNNHATAKTISGTAAKGAAIVGTVVAIDANGEDSAVVTIDDDGSYKLNVTGLDAPFIIIADEEGTDVFFYSYAEAANVIANITPLTTMALALASGEDPAILADDWEAALAADPVTQDEIIAAAQIVYANLEAEFEAAGLDASDFNFFTDEFEADSTGLDAVLDGIQEVEYTFAEDGTTVITITDDNGIDQSVDTNEDVLGDLDFDADGVVGADDHCVTADGSLSADVDQDGCDDANEDVDDDNDGVIDAIDECATADMDLSADIDNDGCDDNSGEDPEVTIETWSLNIAGKSCTVVLGINQCVPFNVQTSVVGEPANLQDVTDDFGDYDDPAFHLTVTQLTDTATVKSFKVTYEIDSQGVVQTIEYTYTYTKQ